MAKAYAFMEPAVPDLPMARRFTATSIACPNCSVPSGTACTGARVCQERLDVALDLMRGGQLAEAPTVSVADTLGLCQECGVERNARGNPVACANHRCERWLPTKRRCRSVIEPRSRYCVAHVPPQQRWN
jgi:hypothetical protein